MSLVVWATVEDRVIDVNVRQIVHWDGTSSVVCCKRNVRNALLCLFWCQWSLFCLRRELRRETSLPYERHAHCCSARTVFYDGLAATVRRGLWWETSTCIVRIQQAEKFWIRWCSSLLSEFFTQHTAHSTQHTAHSTQHTAHTTHNTQHTPHTTHHTPYTTHHTPHKHTNIQTYKHTNIQTHKHTNIHSCVQLVVLWCPPAQFFRSEHNLRSSDSHCSLVAAPCFWNSTRSE